MFCTIKQFKGEEGGGGATSTLSPPPLLKLRQQPWNRWTDDGCWCYRSFTCFNEIRQGFSQCARLSLILSCGWSLERHQPASSLSRCLLTGAWVFRLVVLDSSNKTFIKLAINPCHLNMIYLLTYHEKEILFASSDVMICISVGFCRFVFFFWFAHVFVLSATSDTSETPCDSRGKFTDGCCKGEREDECSCLREIPSFLPLVCLQSVAFQMMTCFGQIFLTDCSENHCQAH